MLHSSQPDLFEPTILQSFEAWKATPGGAHLLKMIYREASFFGERFKRTGQRVSMDYIYHRVRDRLKEIRIYLKGRGVSLPSVGGYTLNNNFTALIARHIEARRLDWAGMFEKREVRGGEQQLAA